MYMVMEYFRCGDLFNLVSDGGPGFGAGEEKAREYLIQIVEGLAALKRGHIAHRWGAGGGG
jgi:serine/threonine protein kinase